MRYRQEKDRGEKGMELGDKPRGEYKAASKIRHRNRNNTMFGFRLLKTNFNAKILLIYDEMMLHPQEDRRDFSKWCAGTTILERSSSFLFNP